MLRFPRVGEFFRLSEGGGNFKLPQSEGNVPITPE
jgi:hypothetical protein